METNEKMDRVTVLSRGFEKVQNDKKEFLTRSLPGLVEKALTSEKNAVKVKYKPIVVQVTETDYARIDAFFKNLGITKTKFIKNLLIEVIKQYDQGVK